jgi:hypothetical protein
MKYLQGELVFNTEQYLTQLKEKRAEYERAHKQKIDYEYQELGVEMQQHFGRNIWWLFWKHDINDLRYAFDICKKNDIKEVNYLIGCIKRRYTSKK